MPFNRTHAIAFTPSNIRSSVPNVAGVYGIFEAGAWIYVGESEHLQRRLLEHTADLTHEMHRHHPTHFVYELTHERAPRQAQLIRECSPRCNKRAAISRVGH
jgi:predicted GIY-YIG superfamily endonuclease